jgi:hypothetical protein
MTLYILETILDGKVETYEYEDECEAMDAGTNFMEANRHEDACATITDKTPDK